MKGAGRDAVLTLPDGRRLSHRLFGDPDRPLLLYFGGLISSRLEPALYGDGRFFIVGVDRPGFGGSDFNPRQTAASFAEDIAALLRALGRPNCRIFTVSGGLAFALAVADARPELVEKIGGFAGLSPFGSVELPPCYIREFAGFVARPWTLRLNCALRCLTYRLPAGLLRRLLLVQPWEHPMEKRALTTEAIAVLKDSFREALRPGTRGLLADLVLSLGDWGGCDPRRVTTPLMLFHGREDTITPDVCTAWYAANLPNCEARYFPGETHLSVPILHAAEMFDWLAKEPAAPGNHDVRRGCAPAALTRS